MKNTIFKFGIYGLLTATVLFLSALSFGGDLSFGAQEIIGYSTMVLSLSFIFFGIKHYRDNVNNGVVSFGKAFLIGLLIAILVGIGICVADYIYTTVINPNFATDYLDKSLKTLQETLTPEAYEIKKAELTQQMQDYGSSSFMAFLMFATVVMIGVVISIISAFILQRKK